jgi:hypothetical protein
VNFRPNQREQHAKIAATAPSMITATQIGKSFFGPTARSKIAKVATSVRPSNTIFEISIENVCGTHKFLLEICPSNKAKRVNELLMPAPTENTTAVFPTSSNRFEKTMKGKRNPIMHIENAGLPTNIASAAKNVDCRKRNFIEKINRGVIIKEAKKGCIR